MSNGRRSVPALEVSGLDVYYGHSHALQGVDLTLDSGVFSVVGRNGMGKTTLCNTIMGLLRASGGAMRVRGEDITRMNPARIARLGVGYVPQGRRLWRSLSVAEHLRLAAGMRRGPWTVERVTMMDNGRIFKEGAPQEIEADPEVQELYLGGGHA